MSFSYPTNVRMTSRNFEKLQSDRRRQEMDATALQKFTHVNQIQTLHNQSDVTVNARRRANQIAQLTAEKMFDDQRMQEQMQKSRLQREKLQNEQLAHVMETDKKHAEQKEREIQRICEASEELRELEAFLKTAYMNKDRAVQQLEKETLKTMDKEREVAIEQQMEYDRQRALVDMQNRELQKRAEAVRAKQVIQTQIIERKTLEQEAQEEAANEKLKIEQIMKQIELEDAQEMAKKEQFREQTRAMIDRTQRERKLALELQHKRQKEEEDAILAYQKHVQSREASVKAANDLKKQEEERKFRVVEAEIRSKMREEEEIARLRDELWEEEMYQKKKHELESKQEAKQKAKEDMMLSNAMQMQLKAQLVEQQKREEDAFNAMLQAKFQSEERRQMELDKFRRQQKEEFKQEIERLQQIKKQMVWDEVQKERKLREDQEREEEYKRQVIEQAKRRLLEQHADVLQGQNVPRHLRPKT